MANTLFSPTRQYVINYKDANTGESHLHQIYRLPDTYVNNVDGASAFCRDTTGIAKQMIISCVPYELHVEMVRKKEREGLFPNELRIEHIKKKSPGVKRETFVVSESRSYVLFIAEPMPPNGGHYYRLEIPAGYENNPYGAKKYFSNEIDRECSIIACIPAEMYDGVDAYLHRDDQLSNEKKSLEDIRIYVGKLYDEIEQRLKNLEE